jgi:hypothetical protein
MEDRRWKMEISHATEKKIKISPIEDDRYYLIA